MKNKKSLSQIERVLEDYALRSQMRNLARAGCDRKELVTAMELAFLVGESWETLVGMDLRALKRALAQIRDCADLIDRLNRSEFIYRASFEHCDPGFVGLHESPTLSDRLRKYSSVLDDRLKLFGPKRKIRTHVWKAWVVAHVVEDTKKLHDLEVSSLIAAILDDPKYSEKAHQAWRLKYSKIIKMMTEKLRDHRRRRSAILPPPPS